MKAEDEGNFMVLYTIGPDPGCDHCDYPEQHRDTSSQKCYAWLKRNAETLPVGDYLVVRIVGTRSLKEEKVVKRSLE